MRSVKGEPSLSPLESAVMQLIWRHGPCSAEQVREGLSRDRALKDSTVRTILRRLADKGYVTHAVEGRTYLYQASVAPQSAAAQAVQRIIDRFCGGSVEQLLVGLVDSSVVNSRELNAIAARIAAAKKNRKGVTKGATR